MGASTWKYITRFFSAALFLSGWWDVAKDTVPTHITFHTLTTPKCFIPAACHCFSATEKSPAGTRLGLNGRLGCPSWEEAHWINHIRVTGPEEKGICIRRGSKECDGISIPPAPPIFVHIRQHWCAWGWWSGSPVCSLRALFGRVERRGLIGLLYLSVLLHQTSLFAFFLFFHLILKALIAFLCWFTCRLCTLCHSAGIKEVLW